MCRSTMTSSSSLHANSKTSMFTYAFLFTIFHIVKPFTVSIPAAGRRNQYTNSHFLSSSRSRKEKEFTLIFMSERKDDQESEEEKRARMNIVRSLQRSFYSSPSDVGENNDSETIVDVTTGTISNLPLWRVGWTELPGRSNVLNVFEPKYTHMFESIIRSNPDRKSWYVGHLFLPGGSKTLDSKTDDSNSGNFRLSGWKDAKKLSIFDDSGGITQRSAVIGTLLRIVDFRRMNDGKLLLLVQALERFVVVRARQETPFSIADVQIIPDEEEVEWQQQYFSSINESITKTDFFTDAVAESFRWHEYEYDERVRLSVRNDEKDDLRSTDISGVDLKRILPFVPYSSTSSPKHIIDQRNKREAVPVNNMNKPEDEILLQIKEAGMLREVPTLSLEDLIGNRSLTTDHLEKSIWIFIDKYLRIKEMPYMPEELLGLLPPNQSWPTGFCLEKLATSKLLENRVPSKKFFRVTNDYPAHRRQKRLSFAASSLLEPSRIDGLRQSMLEIPSTRGRLWSVLEKFEIYHIKNKIDEKSNRE
mmetsp:Transcript_15126/g.17396  ORF Transcript_15126/g.17396 Transcript_15126/m.17396 type:complete len:532 (-) Transcript_15126:96-1691(-)